MFYAALIGPYVHDRPDSVAFDTMIGYPSRMKREIIDDMVKLLVILGMKLNTE
jgi:hypothetical protein